MKNKFILVLVTARDNAEAEKISKILVEEKLAACCNIVDKIRSIYFWDDKMCDESESLILIKTRASGFKKLEKRVRSLHSSEVPEIVAIPVVEGSKKYLNWVKKSTNASNRKP